MTSNMNNTTSMPGYCPYSPRNVRIWEGEVTVMAINSFSILMNILHIVVLFSMYSRFKYPHLLVFIHIAIADLCTAISFLTRLAVTDYSSFENNRIWMNVYDVMLNTTPLTRCLLLTAASIERMLAVWRPMNYHFNCYVKFLSLWMAGFWTASLVITIVRNIAFLDYVCINPLFGPVVYAAPTFLQYILVINIIPNVITVACLVLILVKLCQLRKEVHTEVERQQSQAAAKYVLVIFLIFVICLLSPAVSTMIAKEHKTFYGSAYVDLGVTSMYGILNVPVYGLFSKAYRQHVKKIVCRSSSADLEVAGEKTEHTNIRARYTGYNNTGYNTEGA